MATVGSSGNKPVDEPLNDQTLLSKLLGKVPVLNKIGREGTDFLANTAIGAGEAYVMGPAEYLKAEKDKQANQEMIKYQSAEHAGERKWEEGESNKDRDLRKYLGELTAGNKTTSVEKEIEGALNSLPEGKRTQFFIDEYLKSLPEWKQNIWRKRQGIKQDDNENL